MSWVDGRLCAVDLETTGTDPEHARIVTVAIVLVGGGQPAKTLSLLADPGIEIPAEATAVHGISTEHAREFGQPIRDVIDTALRALSGLPVTVPVVAMNARYDLTVLDRETRRQGWQTLSQRREPLWVVDPLVLDRHLDRFRKGSRRLPAICEHYGATLDQAHDASSDALAAARAAWVIAKRGQVIRRVRNADDGRELARLRQEWEHVRHDLPALHQAQTRWAREQAISLAEHFARKGTPETVQPDWPLIPLKTAASAA